MAVDIGESGALISAILESEGYIYQSEILDKLAPIQEGNVVGLVGAAAAFIFVAALVWGGIQYVFSGGFKFTWWMLIGPTLFFLAVIPRVEVNNTIWKFPNSKDKDQNEVSKYLGRANDLYNTNGSDSKSKVSNVYAEYNKMISIVVNEIVEKIVGSIKELDSKFISRMEKIADLQFLTAQDPGARELFGTILMRQCHDYFTYASKAFATEGTSNSNPVQQGYRQKLEEIKDKEIVVMKGFKYAPEFLANGVAKYGDTYLKIENCQAGNNVSNFIKKLESPNNVENANIKELTGKIEKMTCSCENIWLLSYLTLYYEAYSGAEAIKSKANDDVNEDFKVDLFNVLKIVQLKELEEAENSNTEAPKAPRETISDYLKRHPEAFYGLIARHVLSNNIQDSNAPGHFIADQRVKQNQQVLAFSGANQPFSRVER
ncbi:MAG: hypothetical protein LBE20_06675, partial [Deltaproteobacteria bacterium]|nr:hypothetical protein [Deltaproteobacteria bacterium]